MNKEKHTLELNRTELSYLFHAISYYIRISRQKFENRHFMTEGETAILTLAPVKKTISDILGEV
jgi:hypothetical protein